MSKNRSVKLEKMNHVRVVFEGGETRLPVKVRHVIQRHWESLISSGKKYWNGPLFCLRRIDRSMSKCPVLFVEETNFAHYLATVHGKIPEKYACRSVYVSALLKTADDFFVFGEMAEHTTSPERIQCASGRIKRKYLLPNGSFDIRGNILGELSEKLHLGVEDVEVFCSQPILKTGGDGNIGILSKTKALLPCEEFFRQYIRRRNQERFCGNTPEFHNLVCVPATCAGVRKLLKTNRRQKVDYLEPLLELLVPIKKH